MTETTRVVRLFVRFGMLLVGIGMIFAAAPTLIGNTTDWRAVALKCPRSMFQFSCKFSARVLLFQRG